MEYEVYEPDPGDPYYEQMCSVAYALMFNSGRGNYCAGNDHEYSPPVERHLSDD